MEKDKKKIKETKKLAGCKEDEERMLVKKRRIEGKMEARKKEGRKEVKKEGRLKRKKGMKGKDGRKKWN